MEIAYYKGRQVAVGAASIAEFCSHLLRRRITVGAVRVRIFEHALPAFHVRCDDGTARRSVRVAQYIIVLRAWSERQPKGRWAIKIREVRVLRSLVRERELARARNLSGGSLALRPGRSKTARDRALLLDPSLLDPLPPVKSMSRLERKEPNGKPNRKR